MKNNSVTVYGMLTQVGVFDPHVARNISPELHSGAIEVPWDSVWEHL